MPDVPVLESKGKAQLVAKASLHLRRCDRDSWNFFSDVENAKANRLACNY